MTRRTALKLLAAAPWLLGARKPPRGHGGPHATTTTTAAPRHGPFPSWATAWTG